MAAQIPGSKGVNETSILSWLNAKGALSLGQMRIHGMRKSFWDLRPGRIRPPTMAELVREYQLPQVRYDGSKKYSTTWTMNNNGITSKAFKMKER